MKIATRGFSPQNTVGNAVSFKQALDIELFENIPRFWGDGKSVYPFDNQQYMGVGACVVTRKNWPLVGCWKIGRRELQLDTMSQKRVVPSSERLRKMRASKLVALPVKVMIWDGELSAPSVPDWLSDDRRRARDIDDEQENVMAGFW